MCKNCAEIHPKNLPKDRNFAYLEDPGMLDFWAVSVFFFKILYLDLEQLWVSEKLVP